MEGMFQTSHFLQFANVRIEFYTVSSIVTAIK